MTPARKVATLFLFFGPELSSEILKQMPRASAQKVLNILANLGNVTDEEVESVVREFLPLLKSEKRSASYDKEASQRILDMARKNLKSDTLIRFSEDDAVIETIKEDLQVIRTDVLVNWLSGERPSTIAVVLSLMEPEAGAAAFKRLPNALLPDICVAISELKKAEFTALEALSEELERLRELSSSSSHTLGGKKVLTNMLQNMPAEFRNKLLSDLSEKEAALAEELKSELVTIERLATMTPGDLAKVCAKLSDKELAFVARHELKKIQDVLLAAVSQSRRQCIQDEMDLIKSMKRADLDAARARFIEIANALRLEGKVTYPWEDTLV